MAYTYDLSPKAVDHLDNPFEIDRIKLISQFRLILPDTKNSNEQYVFEDDEVDTLLQFEGDDVRRAVATALETIITDEGLLYKHIEIMNIEVDASVTMKELNKRIAALRFEADATSKWSFA